MAKAAEPWDRPNPRKKAGKTSKHLGTKGKTKAKSIAKAHGRSRPSLVDNMNALKGRGATKKKTVTKKKAATKKKTATKKTAAKRKTVAKKTTRTTAKRKTATKRTTRKAATRKTTTRKTATKTPAAKKPTRASPRARDDSGARIKDPKGGLTAAGRREFGRTQGSHLKPGVTKPESEMSPDEMRRKGSWAVRFYGRAKLPPLVDDKGEPTRLALSAHAWGEPVPKTEPEARKIADKGHELLARYKDLKED